MTEARSDELRRYVRLTAADGELLRALGERASADFPRIACEFYERAREHEDAHTVLSSEEQVRRLQGSLVRWMERVCSGCYDEDYFAETAKIGRTHVRIGLPQRYMFTAMALIRVSLSRVADTLGENATSTREALHRLLDLELATMLEAYQESFVQRIQQVERFQMAELGRALTRTEHRFESAVEHVPALIVGLGPAGDIQLFNREAERISGFARDEVLGQTFGKTLVTQDLQGRVTALIDQILAGEAPSYACETPLTLQTKAGRLCDIEWKFSHAPPTSADDIMLFAMGLDVTGARALEERTRQAEKLAALGNLAAGLAHEIRNPLNGARLHVAFLERALRKRNGDPEMLEATQVVSEEIRRLADLVSEFLEFARPQPLVVRNVQLFQICERACESVRAAASKANLQVVRELPRGDVSFDADPVKLDQVLSNLLTNAVETFDGAGGGRVILRAVRLPREIVFEVEDNGPGLAEPAAPVFDAFYSTKQRGAGLGLAIAYRFVSDHGGTIDVSSEPPRTIFRVVLPLSQPGE